MFIHKNTHILTFLPFANGLEPLFCSTHCYISITATLRSLNAAQYNRSLLVEEGFGDNYIVQLNSHCLSLSLCLTEQCVQHAICTDTQLLYGYGFTDENLYALNVHAVRLIAA